MDQNQYESPRSLTGFVFGLLSYMLCCGAVIWCFMPLPMSEEANLTILFAATSSGAFLFLYQREKKHKRPTA